jgi:glycosyltransferase involved in cell wall biosynthesis
VPTNVPVSNGDSAINVCVIITCHNNTDTVLRAIESVLKQDYKALNMIIVDDGSTDNSYVTIRQLLTDIKTDTLDGDEESFTVGLIGSIPTVLISHEKREGIAMSKNKGIMAGWHNAKYFSVLAATDSFMPDKISQCVAIMEADKNVAFVYHNLKIMIDGGAYTEYLPPYDREVIEEAPITLAGALISKEALEALGAFEQTLLQYEDWDLLLRITERYMAIQIPKVLGVCTSTPSNEEAVRAVHQRLKTRKV